MYFFIFVMVFSGVLMSINFVFFVFVVWSRRCVVWNRSSIEYVLIIM